ERRVDLVEDAEGRRLHEVDREQEGDRRERPLAAREQRDALQILAARPRRDLDLALERILAHHAQCALAALEERREGLLEVLLDVGEGVEEELRSGRVDLLDRLQELRLGLQQIVALRGQEGVALLLLVELLEREQVDRPERAIALAAILEQALGLRGIP